VASFLEQVGNVARDAVQGLACGVENYQEFIRRVSPLSDVFPPPPSLWPLLCPDRPPPPQAFPRPPFEGGQCEGVTYRIEGLSAVTKSAGDPDGTRQLIGNGNRNVIGPVGGFTLENPLNDGFRRIGIRTGVGVILVRDAPGDSVWYSDPLFTAIVRVDGEPDDCGNPPSEYPIPPAPFPPLPPEDRPVTDPDGGPDINFTFAPTLAPIFIDIDGSVNVPVNVNVSGPNIFAPVDIPVNINLPTFAPSFNFGGGGGGGNPGPPTSPCCEPPTVPGPGVEGEEDQPIVTEPPPEGLRMYGVQVLSQVEADRTSATNISTGSEIPDLWVPRIGSVYFELDVSNRRGSVRLLYSQDYDVKLTNQIVIGPPEGKILRAFIRPGKGVRATAIPLFTAARN